MFICGFGKETTGLKLTPLLITLGDQNIEKLFTKALSVHAPRLAPLAVALSAFIQSCIQPLTPPGAIVTSSSSSIVAVCCCSHDSYPFVTLTISTMILSGHSRTKSCSPVILKLIPVDPAGIVRFIPQLI